MTAPNLLDELEGVVAGELDATAPAVIWLQLDTDGDNEQRDEPWSGRDGVTWCDESIGGLEIQYVRADLYRDMAKRLEAAERDSERIEYLQRAVDEDDALLLHNGPGRGSGFIGLGLKNTGRTLRQAIDQCLEADAATQEGEG